MDNTKRAIADEVTEKEIPRAAYEGVLTIDVDAQVESMEEQEDARWHQLLNAHRTRKVLTGLFYLFQGFLKMGFIFSCNIITIRIAYLYIWQLFPQFF